MIYYILLLSLFIWGFAALFTDGMLLEKLGDKLIGDKDDPEAYKKSSWFNRKWHKPIFTCPICMSSFWGTVAALILYMSIPQWLMLVFGTCGFNFIVSKLLDR